MNLILWLVNNTIGGMKMKKASTKIISLLLVVCLLAGPMATKTFALILGTDTEFTVKIGHEMMSRTFSSGTEPHFLGHSGALPPGIVFDWYDASRYAFTGTAQPGSVDTYSVRLTDQQDNSTKDITIHVAKGDQTIAVDYDGNTDVSEIYVPVSAVAFTLDAYSKNGNDDRITAGSTHAPTHTFSGGTAGTATVNTTSGEITVGSTAGTATINIDAETTDSYEAATQKQIAIHVLPLATTPTATINYVSEKLKALTDGADYAVDGGAALTATGGEIAIDESWMDGAAHAIVKKGNGTIIWDSAAQNLTIPERPAAPAVTGMNETVVEANDGKITGVSALMEWSENGGLSWTDCTGTEIPALVPGDYKVRLKATATAFVGTAADVIIDTGAAQTRTLTVTAVSFGSAAVGYTRPAAKDITITNSGNSDATIADVTVSGTAFEIGGTQNTNVPANGGTNTTWTVQPKANLGVGTYSETITVTYDGVVPATANVSFEVVVTPVAPSVLPTTLNITVGGTDSFTVYLGEGAGAASLATATSIDPAVASIANNPVTVVTSGSAITVTGVSAGTTQISIGWSGGTKDGQTDTVDVTVNAIDHDPINPPAPGVPIDTASDALFAFKGDYADLDEIKLNNRLLIQTPDGAKKALSGYPGYAPVLGHAEAGSVKVTLYKEFLKTLPNGVYSLTVSFSDGGEGELEFEIQQLAVNPGSGISSGSGGSSATTTPTYPVTVTTKSDYPTTAKMTLTKSPDKNSALTFTITKEMVRQALDKAKEEAKKHDCENRGYALEFYFSTSATIDSLNITFNADALALLESAGVKETAVTTNSFRFGFDLAAIKELNSQSGGAAVTVSALRFTKLSDAAKAYIGIRPAWDISVSYKKVGKTESISNLGKGFITMGMKYTPASTEKTGNLAVVYVPGSGQPQILTDSSYDDGWMNWQQNSLSVYGVGYITPAPAFADTVSHWAKDDIDFVAGRGLVSGVTSTTFAPDTAITRADFLMALGKLSVADVSGYTASSFNDVPKTSAAMPYIEWAVKNKIVQGIGDNKFDPDNLITREQMAVMMVNYAKVTGYTLPVSRQAVAFADDAKISGYARDAVKTIQQTGVISGKPNNLFDPQGSATRAEASAILCRFVELVESSDI